MNNNGEHNYKDDIALGAEDIVATDYIVYKETSEEVLKLHIFNPIGHSSKNISPAILFFFGGSWIDGTVTQFYPQSEHLAKRGIVSICAEYRVKNKHDTDPRECIKDCKSAIRFIRENSNKLGIDFEKIAVGGGSAGGHMAAAAAFINDFDDEKGDKKIVSCLPNALVLFNPVIDNSEHGFGYKWVKEYWRKFSPLHNITHNAPPTIIFQGDSDELIPVSTSRAFINKIKESSPLAELHIFKKEKHGFFNLGIKENKRYYEIEKLLDQFFKKIDWI